MPCRFCGGTEGDGHLSEDCTFLPLVEIREHPEFHGMVGCLCSLWSMVVHRGRRALLRVPVTCLSVIAEWQLPDGFDAGDAAARVAAEPDVCTDGSLPPRQVPGSFLVVLVIFGTIVGGVILMMVLEVPGLLGACRVFLFCSWSFTDCSKNHNSGVILALQAADVHLGVDNLSVARHVGRLLNGNVTSRPAELVKICDLITLVGRMLRLRGLDTVRIAEVKGHADEGMVRDGGVRELDRLGNNAADEAADFGRGRGIPDIDDRRNFGGVCGWWYPVVLILHRFFIAFSRAVVDHVEGDGTAPDPLVWSVGALPMRRRLVHAVRDRAFFCLGLLVFGTRNGLVFVGLFFEKLSLACW